MLCARKISSGKGRSNRARTSSGVQSWRTAPKLSFCSWAGGSHLGERRERLGVSPPERVIRTALSSSSFKSSSSIVVSGASVRGFGRSHATIKNYSHYAACAILRVRARLAGKLAREGKHDN